MTTTNAGRAKRRSTARSPGRPPSAWRRARPLATVGLLALLGLTGCPDSSSSSGGQRVIVIGIDGASPRLMGPMMKAGRLPHLAALAKRGHYGKLRSIHPLYSPRVWNSIATGRQPEEHGIEAFVFKDDDGKHLYLSSQRRVPAIWNITSHAGLETAVINWWTTYPPEMINGVMVSDHFFPEQIAMLRKTFKDSSTTAYDALVHPPDLIGRLRPLLDVEKPLTPIHNPFEEPERTLWPWVQREVLSRQFETDSDVTRVAMAVEEEIHPQVAFVFLPGIDRVSHWLWGGLESPDLYPIGLRGTDAERAGTADTLRLYYEYTDHLIGKLTAPYGPDDLILVISDHGFEHHVSMMLLTGGHESDDALDGIVVAAGRDIEDVAGRAGIYQIAPTVLAWLGVAPGADFQDHPAPFYTGPRPDPIPSYDEIPIERMRADEGMSTEIVEHLKALGYLEDDVLVPDARAADERPNEATSPR